MRSAAPARRIRSAFAAITAAALVVGGVLVTPMAANAAEGEVSGTVFRDFNGNGVLDTGNSVTSGVANDRGVAGVLVTAVDGTGTELDTFTTTDSGQYTLDVTEASGADIRVEFSNWPSQYQPSGTSTLGTNGTSVQFVASGAENVDFALNAPGDYSQDNPPIITAIQRAGSPFESEGGTVLSTSSPAVAALPYGTNFPAGTNQEGFPDRVVLATFGEVGAVDSVVYQRQSNSVFAFATYRRASGLGEKGLGGIYRITDVRDENGDVSDEGDVIPWLDVTDENGLNIDLGQELTLSNTDRGIAAPDSDMRDLNGFALTGTVGFGGATLSPDGNTLYFINLFDKKLYTVDLSGLDPADLDATPTADDVASYDLDLEVGQRPWAVYIDAGQLYLGYVDTGEDADGMHPGLSAADAGLRAYVLRVALDANGTPAHSGTTLAGDVVLDADLGYTKGTVFFSTMGDQARRWNTWTDTWRWPGGSVGDNWQIYPQPVLTSLYIDEGGFLTLGMRDRTESQGGNRGVAAEETGTTRYQTATGGDLLIAAPTASGGFELESAGIAGTRTGAVTTAEVFGNNSDGHNGPEFYDDGQNVGTGTSHLEVAVGAVLGMRGTHTTVSTAYDPLNRLRLAGLAWYDVDNGQALAGYELTTTNMEVPGASENENAPSLDGGFQKGGGLGAVTLLADEAPVEIGNRVWFDADQDGIQDADEPNVQGVTVELWPAGEVGVGEPIAEVETDANGNYVFRSDDPDSGFDVSGDYVVRFVKPTTGTANLMGPNADVFGDLEWSEIDFVTPGAGDGGGLDSDADPTTGEVPVTIAGPGMNNHDLDAGFIANTDFRVVKAIDPDGGAPDTAETFVIDIAARDFRGDSLTLNTAQVTLAGGASSATFTAPVGTQIKVSEAATGYKNVVITGPGTADADGYYPLSSTTGGYVLTVTNTLYLPGTVSIEKLVTGDFSLADSELADAVFTVDYSYTGGTGRLVLNADNDWTATTPELPYGTVLTLEEAAPTGAAASVAFGAPVWSAGGTDADGEAEITIGEGGTALTLTNPTTALSGTFQVTKNVTGDGSALVEGDPEYQVGYTSAAGNGTLQLRDGQTVDGPELPTGTVVTITEVTPDNGLLPEGAAWGDPVVRVDGNVQSNGSTFVIGDNTTVEVEIENPVSTTPDVTIHKGDGDAASGMIVHEADTVGDGEVYAPGETRDIVIRVSNTGPEPLREVTLTDTLSAGAPIENLEFSFPDGTTASATFTAEDGSWAAEWAATFGSGTAEWMPGEVIVGTATLTLDAGDGPHQDTVRVDAVSTLSGTPVSDEDPYNAFTAGIQVIKYDGEKADPAVTDGTGWITPAKPLIDADQDANDADHAVGYTAGEANTVRWVVTNTGDTWLTDIDLADVTDAGAAISAWTADLSEFGGDAAYDFVASGTWHGLLPPGASFFAEGELTLGVDAEHADTVRVEATPVVPEEDANGVPTRDPRIDNGTPVRALDEGGQPIRLRDADPFHATTHSTDVLAGTGVDGTIWVGAGLASLLLLGGAVMLFGSRRRLNRA